MEHGQSPRRVYLKLPRGRGVGQRRAVSDLALHVDNVLELRYRNLEVF